MNMNTKEFTIKIGAKTFKLTLLPINELRKRIISLVGNEQSLNVRVAFTDHYAQEIYVSLDVHRDLIREAIVHEMLHVLLDDSGTSSLSGSILPDFNEILVSSLAPRLTQVMVENEEFFKKLFCGEQVNERWRTGGATGV